MKPAKTKADGLNFSLPPYDHMSDAERVAWREIRNQFHPRDLCETSADIDRLRILIGQAAEARADYNALRSARDHALEAEEDQRAIRLDKQIIVRGEQVAALLRDIVSGPDPTIDPGEPLDPDGPGALLD